MCLKKLKPRPDFLVILISESEKRLSVSNVSLEEHVQELEERLDEINNQLQEKEKVCDQEKENLSLEINVLKNKLSSTSAELLNVVSENNDMKFMLNSYEGKNF